MQEAAPAPGFPMRILGLGSIFHGTKTDPLVSEGFCLSLDIIAFLPRVGWQQTDCPDDSIKASGVLGLGQLLDVSSAGLPPNPDDSMTPHFTLLEAGD